MAKENSCVDIREMEFAVELNPKDLKIWPKCNRIKESGNKKELFER